MDLKLQGRNIQINERIRAYVTRKLSRLDRLLPENSLAEVEVTSSTTRSQSDRITIQATIKSAGVTLRAEQQASNANAAIDLVVDILERKIAKFKTQTYRSKRTSTPFRVMQAEGAE